MDKTEIKIPEGAEFAGTLKGLQQPVWYRNVQQDSFEFSYGGDWETNPGKPYCQPLIPIRQPIKSLEERIKDRAIAALADDVEKAMRRLRNLAQGAEYHPTSVDYMNISEAIDIVGAAIMKARSPVVADKALDKALERLTDQVDPSRLYMTAGPSSK